MKNKVFILFLMFLLASPLYSQSFQTEMDSLSALKKSLTAEKDQLNVYTDSLANYINALDKVLNKNEKELAELKKKLFIKKYGRTNGSRVFEGRIWKGMTEEMMRDVWGKPDKTHTDKHPWGVFTQYYYGNIIYFFKNSVLIDWQQGSEKKN